MGRDALITVFGGSGFVGRHTVRALAQSGWRVRAAVRRPDLAGHLQPMGNVGQIHAVQANVRYPQSVRAAVEGADAVVNLVGILAPTGRQSFDAVHVAGAEAIARATAQAGISRLVHMSALGADPKSDSAYARSKGRAEQAVLQACPGAVILRPSIIFGPEDEFFNRFAAMAAAMPLLPLIGGGRTRFQPVFVGDVAEAIKNICEGAGTPGIVYELGGPEIATFRQLLEQIRNWTGRHPGFLPLPFWLAKLIALLSWPLPSSVRPMTVDQVRLLQKDNILSEAAMKEGRTLAALGVERPLPAAAIVPEYLEPYRRRGQFAGYRG
jgi:NADH dehydrogenase